MADTQLLTWAWFKDQVGDALYSYAEPIRGALRSLVERRYRVTYRFDGGMSMMKATDTFTAWNDREARRKAREIAGTDRFELELYRPVKTKKKLRT